MLDSSLDDDNSRDSRVFRVELSIRRIHHPSGAAPLGTPVRARFCNGLRLLIYQTDPLPSRGAAFRSPLLCARTRSSTLNCRSTPFHKDWFQIERPLLGPRAPSLALR